MTRIREGKTYLDSAAIFGKIKPVNMAKKIQKISSYFAVFEPAKEGGYNVLFPDFPGCVTFGKTFEEAKAKAKEILELWLEELACQKQRIPKKTARPIIDEIKVALPQNVC